MAKSYPVIKAVKKDGEEYAAGESITLDDETADTLIEDGFVGPAVAAAEAAPKAGKGKKNDGL